MIQSQSRSPTLATDDQNKSSFERTDHNAQSRLLIFWWDLTVQSVFKNKIQTAHAFVDQSSSVSVHTITSLTQSKSKSQIQANEDQKWSLEFKFHQKFHTELLISWWDFTVQSELRKRIHAAHLSHQESFTQGVQTIKSIIQSQSMSQIFAIEYQK